MLDQSFMFVKIVKMAFYSFINKSLTIYMMISKVSWIKNKAAYIFDFEDKSKSPN